MTWNSRQWRERAEKVVTARSNVLDAEHLSWRFAFRNPVPPAPPEREPSTLVCD